MTGYRKTGAKGLDGGAAQRWGRYRWAFRRQVNYRRRCPDPRLRHRLPLPDDG